LLALAVAGCTVVEQKIPPDKKVWSQSFKPSKGIPVSGVWVAADCRAMLFSNTDFLDKLEIKWQVAPAGADLDTTRFALLTGRQVARLNENGRRSFSYVQVIDRLAFVLMRAASPVANATPEFYYRTDAGTLLDFDITPKAALDGRSIDLRIAVSESDPETHTVPAEWVGSLRMPVAGSYVLVDIPTARDHPAGTQSRVMLLFAPESFEWKDGRRVTVLPWGRARITTIENRAIGTTWVSKEKKPK
jgi:hypothetical protein